MSRNPNRRVNPVPTLGSTTPVRTQSPSWRRVIPAAVRASSLPYPWAAGSERSGNLVGLPWTVTAGATDHRQPKSPHAVAPARPAEPPRIALEADRVVPPSGNLWIGGQQIWLGPALAGRTVTIWADETTLHVLLDGTRLKTLPSRLGITELARLAATRPPGRAIALADRQRHGDRGRADGQRHRPGRPRRHVPAECRLRTRRPARHAPHGRHPDGRHQLRRRTPAHPALSRRAR